MPTTGSLSGRTIIMSGGSRGIGLAIAVRAARDGANVALLAKTGDPDPRLPGTIHTAAAQIEAAGGQALPILGDVRDDATVAQTRTCSPCRHRSTWTASGCASMRRTRSASTR